MAGKRTNRVGRVDLAFLIFSLSALVFATNSHALPAEVSETGQITSYATGDDGALKPGRPWPSPRFTANGNGTVTDNLTGLIWLQNANCSSTVGGIAKTAELNWDDALTWSNALATGYCGLTDGSAAADWRLPNLRELLSLTDASRYNPALPGGHPFSGVQPTGYWTSSKYGSSIWKVDMYDGMLADYYGGYVWPVRGGQFGNPVMAVSPTSCSYPSVPLNGSSIQTVTIGNSATAGASRLQLNAMALRGNDPGQFSINPGTGSGGTCGSTTPILAPGASCTVTVSFTPTSPGSKSALLRISSSAVNAPNTDIPLYGSGSGHTVTASISGGNGSISSTNPVTTASGAPVSFTLSPAVIYQPASSVSGTCPAGSFNGNTYTTAPITADCTVVFSFIKVTYSLTVTINGTNRGVVAVTPKPPAIDCINSCVQSFDSGTVVTLAPIPSGGYVFSGWTYCPLVSGGLCTITMDSGKSIMATFIPLADAGLKVGTTAYSTIAGASSAVADGGEISLKAGTLSESLTFNRNITFTLKGGYSSDFQNQTETTAISGSIIITAGTAILDGIAIQ